ncbi:activation of NF-kappaB-inducing kinase [Desmophyllum pertusum]|uniref:Activation of NF-kappaB-inducing kinase n=1 Tax=Desmophyllum pertusum TaxID=174260 RepID=A0A9W9YKN9_9CNID|nr:activation of NF-kappaB-inducing kinase [Desmophyllum pertusum]
MDARRRAAVFLLDRLLGESGSDGEEFDDDFDPDFSDYYDDRSRSASRTSSEEDEEETRPMLTTFGGYDYEFVDKVSDSQTCPVCLLPMKDAVQTTECGHRFCNDCLHGILRSENPVCPNDRQNIKANGGFFSDKAWARDILCLRVKCKQITRGCHWFGQLRHAEKHQGDCPYEEEQCSDCGDYIQRRHLNTHYNEECPQRLVECAFCHHNYRFAKKKLHEDNFCHRFPLVCTNNCGALRIPREEMKTHISDHCPMTEVTCPYANAGCPFKDKRAHLNRHMESSVDNHLWLTWYSLVETKQELGNLKDLRQKYVKVQLVNAKLTQSSAEFREEIRDLSVAVKRLEAQNAKQMKQIEDLTRKLEKSTSEEKMSVDRRPFAFAGKRENADMINRQLNRGEIQIICPPPPEKRKNSSDNKPLP